MMKSSDRIKARRPREARGLPSASSILNRLPLLIHSHTGQDLASESALPEGGDGPTSDLQPSLSSVSCTRLPTAFGEVTL